MNMPAEGTPVTAAQVELSINIKDFSSAEPGNKGWHEGLFEPWSMSFGYPEGKPLYGEVKVGNASYHIYYLNDGHKCPIILKQGQTPADYGISPEKSE